MANISVFRNHIKTPFLVLLVLEALILVGSVFAGVYLRHMEYSDTLAANLEGLWIKAAIFATATIMAMVSTGLYLGHIREGVAGIILRVSISLFAGAIVYGIVIFIFPEMQLGRGELAIALLLAFFLINTIRTVFFEMVDTSTFKKRVLVYGAGETASLINRRLRRKSDRRGFTIVGYVQLPHQECKVEPNAIIELNSYLRDFCAAHQIDEIVVATSDSKSNVPVQDLVYCRFHGIEVVDILSFFEREAGQIRIDILDPDWLIKSEGFGTSGFRHWLKRGFDIIASLIIAVFSSPFVLATMIAIKLEDGARSPLLYSQIRVGAFGREYRVYKFRSMSIDAEKSGAQWATTTDSRVTKVGQIIRKTRIDEIPQIWNVLNGTMSFVGPRPERPEFMDELKEKIPYYNERHLVKPGVTGWAQLMYPYGSSVSDAYQKHLYDMYYVKNHTLFLDLLILLQTVEVVLFGKGAR